MTAGDQVCGPAVGRLTEWHAEDGWGVMKSSTTPGGCWVHYSSLTDLPSAEMRVGDDYAFTYEPVEQDAYHYRATAVGPQGGDVGRVRRPVHRSGETYRSTLRLTFDAADPRFSDN